MTRKKAKPPETPGQTPVSDQAADDDKTAQPAVPTDPLEAAQAERDDLLARLQRVSADYVNYQKRARRDLDRARQFANDDLIKALLPVIDGMEDALRTAGENHGADDPLFKGMQLVHDKACETLGRFGVKAIEAKGKPFDPDRHTAMQQLPADDCEPNTVMEETQRGYELRGRTIRPTSVIVSKAPDAERDQQEDLREEQ